MSFSFVRYPRADWFEPWAVGERWDRVWGMGSGIFGSSGSSGSSRTIFDVPGPVFVPDTISEVPQTWEELEVLHPEVFEPILETRPGQVPDPYPQDTKTDDERSTVNPIVIIGNPTAPDTPEQEEEQTMAHDWGHLARQFISDVAGWEQPSTNTLLPGTDVTAPVGTGTVLAHTNGDCDGMAWSGGTPPKGYKVVNSCGRGVLRKVRRRRRRRLLTASDSRDIATIVGLVGKGQMASALINRR